MSRHVMSIGLGCLASAALTLAGCASAARTAEFGTPKEVIAGSAEKPAWWNPAGWWKSNPASALAVEKDVQNPGKLHLAYARYQESLGNLIAARESYELAMGDDPKSVDAVLGLARLDQLNGRHYEAEQRYLKALKLRPNDPNVLDAVGQYYASQERWGKSIELLTEAMQLAPQETSHRFNLAVALARSGRLDEAMPHFSRTVGDAEAHYNVGYILYQKNDMVGAERHLLQAVVARPDLAQAQQMLDEVRHAQADRLMFAGGRDPSSSHGSSNSGRIEPTGAQRYSERPESGGGYRNDAHAAPTATTTPQNYRPQYQQSPADSRPQAAQAGFHQPGGYQPPPWHASPDFGGSSRASQQNLPSATQGNSSPGVTPEQAEQWRNQLSPAGDGRGY